MTDASRSRAIVEALRRGLRRARFSLLRLYARARWSDQQRLLALTIVVGVACGLAAVGFHVAIEKLEVWLFGTAVPRFSVPWIPWIVIIPTLGGLLSGILLHRFAPEARGSGIPQVKAAYATPGGEVQLRVAAWKFGIGALQIGTGSSLGREGPTVQICAGIASRIGKSAGLSRKSLRRMLPVGAAAGIAAAFNAPIAAVTFAIEEIVGDLDQAVLSGVIIAAALAAAIERSVLGAHPVFQVSQQYSLEHTSSLLFYAILGVLAAIVSVAFTDLLLGLRLRFRRMHRVPEWFRPAIGGLVTGLLAVAALSWVRAGGILGGGYETLSMALGGGFAVRTLLVLGVLKLLATVVSYSSGGAGGIFAPSLFIGGMLGGAVGYLDRAIFAGSSEQVGAFALVGMGAVFAGIIRAPITSVLIIFEMTDGYSLILPLMIANMTAFGLARRWRPVPIYEALLAQDGIQLPRRGAVVGRTPVAAAMTTKAITIPAEISIAEALERVREFEYTTFPVVEASGRFAGFVNRSRLEAQMRVGGGERPVVESVSRAEYVLPNMTLQQAAVRLNSIGAHVIAVVDGEETRKFLGILTSSDIVRTQATVGASEFDETMSSTGPRKR
ncbi:MAG TPA: chloride channel protein [Thermoanaerobaculia bacterium]|nr:chloride channel protein [Thermoanaerobaculia bacterium]